ncbi:MAG TPA: LacI family DNA-binding transcriptional regulator [Blastocatellia bacterium]|nr:LacI family DNA-binding transcriptional regulator [Blastocatellia bacterium]
MKDIAQDLGVSMVTVSKALRNHPDISQETRERVLKRMEELNYRPNLAARALVTGKTHLMGLVVPDLVHSFFSQLANAISNVLRGRGYGLVISSSQDDPELEQQEIDHLLARSADCLFIASTQRTIESFRQIEEQARPYILIDRKFQGLAANFVGVDDELVGEMATQHLIEIGCRRIAHIGAAYASPALGRLAGYRRALARHGLEVPEDYILSRPHGDNAGDATGYEIMKRLLNLRPLPDAVFCHNDPTALGAMKAILEAGFKIPEEIAIMGCGNVKYSEFLRVPLSTIDQSCEAMGERAAELALRLLESKTPPQPQALLLEPRLIVRESTRRIQIFTNRETRERLV